MGRTRHESSTLQPSQRLRKVASKWLEFSRSSRETPPDVPPGHVAVSVGDAGRRFVIRASYLNRPLFRQLLDEAYEEYGHKHDGPISFPCNELVFEELARSVGKSEECHVVGAPCSQATDAEEVAVWSDSRPLLHGLPRTTTW